MSCQVTFEKKGCFKDDQKPPRPLPNYILTDRDSSLKIYSGKEIDWGNWVNYLPDFVCRCAQLAKSKNFKFFGIQYYGMFLIFLKTKYPKVFQHDIYHHWTLGMSDMDVKDVKVSRKPVNCNLFKA